jgi:hypothetical protein
VLVATVAIAVLLVGSVVSGGSAGEPTGRVVGLAGTGRLRLPGSVVALYAASRESM